MGKNGVATYGALGRNGRMCNAFFQAAATISFAIDRGKDFVFPPWVYSQWMQKHLPMGALPYAINTPLQFHYAPIEDYPGRNVNIVNGHGQSEKYFKHNWEAIKPYLTLKEEYKTFVRRRFYANFHGWHGRTCSIHVRLTDYTNPINIEYHGMCGPDYYRKAIAALYGNESPNDVLFVIFSDDIEKAKEMFHLPNMNFVIPDDSIVPKMKDFSGLDMGNGDLMDLYMMSLCTDNIICNSSFSWWGAWLNENPSKRVVAPLHWFNKAPINYADVVPEGWIKIDNRETK